MSAPDNLQTLCSRCNRTKSDKVAAWPGVYPLRMAEERGNSSGPV